MKQYLNEPDKLFRRVRDEYGVLQLSKNARAYHPGRGVYRSSYKNAVRLTRSEINMAYRTAEQTRWRQFDFVVGYEIKLSQSHPCEDVCDELAGKYPKDFVWTGWHPNDLCYCVSILKTDSEFWRDLENGDNGGSSNEIKDVPDAFKEWVSENADRIEAARERGTEPYFIRDNKDYIDGILEPTEVKNTVSNIAERHAVRTQEDINKIQSMWNSNRLNHLIMLSERIGAYQDAGFRELASLLENENNTKEFNVFKRDYKQAKEYIRNKINKETSWAIALRSNSQFKETLEAFEKIFGKVGQPMTYYEANTGHENPLYLTSVGYRENCQTCTMTHWLRRIGFNVTAKPNEKIRRNAKGSIYDEMDNLGINWRNRFRNLDNSAVNYNFSSEWKFVKRYEIMTYNRIKEYLKERLSDNGLYEIYCGWKKGSAHVFCAEVNNGNIRYFDPQTGRNDVAHYIELMKGDAIGVIRIDNKKLDARLANLFNLVK